MAKELSEKARGESNDLAKSEFEFVAQIYSLLAQRAYAFDKKAPALTALLTPQKGGPIVESDAKVVESDAKGLQQQVRSHFDH